MATAVPGATTVEEVEENSLIGGMEDSTLTKMELKEVARFTDKLDHVRCRICSVCDPCPVGISIGSTLGTDVMCNHYRTMGRAAFAAFPWSQGRVKKDSEQRLKLVGQIEACDECGLCEERCPYDLPVSSLLKATIPSMNDMLKIWSEQGLSQSKA
jgi:hypothetical protein